MLIRLWDAGGLTFQFLNRAGHRLRRRMARRQNFPDLRLGWVSAHHRLFVSSSSLHAVPHCCDDFCQAQTACQSMTMHAVLCDWEECLAATDLYEPIVTACNPSRQVALLCRQFRVQICMLLIGLLIRPVGCKSPLTTLSTPVSCFAYLYVADHLCEVSVFDLNLHAVGWDAVLVNRM